MYIVYYHNVIDGPIDAYDRKLGRLSKKNFEKQVDFITKRLRAVALPSMLDRFEHDTVAFTFDDGFRGVLDHAFPVLAARGIPASVFVVTNRIESSGDEIFHFDELELAFRLTQRRRYLRFDFLGPLPHPMFSPVGRRYTLKRIKNKLKVLPEDERRHWHARILDALDVTPDASRAHARSLDKFRTLSRADLQKLIDAGWTVGSHTRTHRTLSRLPADELHDEIAGSRADLERFLGLHEIALAYPYGGSEHINAGVRDEASRAGFTCALTTIPGTNSRDVDRYALRRMKFAELRKALSRRA
jgi:peptidoglycan/xylan/chitin deacetylase (PgdA/CDA1 family)